MKRVKPDYHGVKTIIQRFSMAMVRWDSKIDLVAALLAAIAVTMNELSPEEREKVKAKIDTVRVLY